MNKQLLANSFCCGLLLLLGCESLQSVNVFQQRLANRSEIEKRLPTDVKLDMIVCLGPSWKDRSTVEQELVKMYAHVGKDGKICDASGQEIHFATVVDSTAQPARQYKLTDKDKEELDRVKDRQPTLIAVITEPRPTF